LIELMVVVAIIGILAAVAIPAFMKNARKAKTSEATLNIKKIYDGARSYYQEELTTRGVGTPIPKQFPDTPTVSIEPALGTCCASTGKKCRPNPTLWTDRSWQALHFSMDDPHYFSYYYQASNAAAIVGDQFTAGANGDLNCDTNYSTFEMVGRVMSDYSVSGSAGIYKDRELD
jgi:type IV pilus assembly protein PilA